MVLIGVNEGMVVLCVSITDDQLHTVAEMYPDYLLLEQVGEENIGCLFDGVNFIDPTQA